MQRYYQLALHRTENQGTVLQPENLNASKTKLSMLVKRREYHFDISDEFNPIKPGGGGHMAPLGKHCSGTKIWTGPEARAFGTLILI